MARTPEELQAWRAFPWHADARPGEPFSPEWVPPIQGQGRFDLPATPGGVMYLAQTPEHAVAELIQHFRGHVLEEADLRVAGNPLALVRVTIGGATAAELVDLCDPAVLMRHGIRPDATAASNRRSTQRIAADLHAAGFSGLRWWSALRGEWHTLVLFRDRLTDALRFDTPQPLSLSHPAVIEATIALGIRRR